MDREVGELVSKTLFPKERKLMHTWYKAIRVSPGWKRKEEGAEAEVAKQGIWDNHGYNDTAP